MQKEQLIQLALESGVAKAAVIEQAQIVLSPVFREICAQNSCGSWGKCWMCPPDVGDIDELMARVHRYPFGLLYQTIAQLEDSYDVEGMAEGGHAHVQVSQKLQRAVLPVLGREILHLTCGGCGLCAVCAKRTGEPCRYPEQALPSMESYGIDVYNTAKGTALRYINGQNTVTFFGIVLFGEHGNVSA